MTTVFVGGSRQVSHLSASVLARLDGIVGKSFPVLVGDADGADKALQEYLDSKNYRQVTVFCAGGVCRNNVGRWERRDISTTARTRNAEFFSAKDRVMADEATVGLMIWDVKSVGTLLNVYRLLALDKNVLVYSVPESRFMDFKHRSEWDALIARCDGGLRHKVAQRLLLEQPSGLQSAQATLHI